MHKQNTTHLYIYNMNLSLCKLDDEVLIDEYTAFPVTRQVDGVKTKLWLICDCENGDAYYVRRQDRTGYMAIGLCRRGDIVHKVFIEKHRDSMDAMEARHLWQLQDSVPSYWYGCYKLRDAPVPSQKGVHMKDHYVYRY